MVKMEIINCSIDAYAFIVLVVCLITHAPLLFILLTILMMEDKFVVLVKTEIRFAELLSIVRTLVAGIGRERGFVYLSVYVLSHAYLPNHLSIWSRCPPIDALKVRRGQFHL